MTNIAENPQKIQMPERWPGELKALLILGIPMGLAQLIQFSIYTVDTVMLGRIGPDALAAAALGTVVYFLLWMIGTGPVMAVSPLVSQALGADQNDLLRGLQNMIPQVVDKSSSGGSLLDSVGGIGGLASLAGKFLK